MPTNAPVQERVFLVVVDETEELRVALRYAARRAQHTGGRVALLYVIEPTELQHWGAVESLMKEERREEAEALLQKLAAEVTQIAGTMPIIYIREGRRRDEAPRPHRRGEEHLDPGPRRLHRQRGAGPLITAVTGKLAARLRIPVTIVPGGLTDAEIDALA